MPLGFCWPWSVRRAERGVHRAVARRPNELRFARLLLEELEDRTLFTATPFSLSGAIAPDDPVGVSGDLGPAEFWSVTLTDGGRLTAQVHTVGASGFPTRLSLWRT